MGRGLGLGRKEGISLGDGKTNVCKQMFAMPGRHNGTQKTDKCARPLPLLPYSLSISQLFMLGQDLYLNSLDDDIANQLYIFLFLPSHSGNSLIVF